MIGNGTSRPGSLSEIGKTSSGSIKACYFSNSRRSKDYIAWNLTLINASRGKQNWSGISGIGRWMR